MEIYCDAATDMNPQLKTGFGIVIADGDSIIDVTHSQKSSGCSNINELLCVKHAINYCIKNNYDLNDCIFYTDNQLILHKLKVEKYIGLYHNIVRYKKDSIELQFAHNLSRIALRGNYKLPKNSVIIKHRYNKSKLVICISNIEHTIIKYVTPKNKDYMLQQCINLCNDHFGYIPLFIDKYLISMIHRERFKPISSLDLNRTQQCINIYKKLLLFYFCLL